MNKKSIYFYLLLLTSCTSSNYLDLTIVISKNLHKKIDNGFVVVVAEYDCKSCLQNIIEFCHSEINNNNIDGIFYQTTNLDVEYNNLIKSTKGKIKWHYTKSIKLMNLLSEKIQNGPYLIEFRNGYVYKIQKI